MDDHPVFLFIGHSPPPFPVNISSSADALRLDLATFCGRDGGRVPKNCPPKI